MRLTDRSPTRQPAPGRWWAVLLAVTLGVAGAGMGLLTWRQAQLLDGHRQFRADYGPWSAFQLEGEALRLAGDIRRYLDAPSPALHDAAGLRLDLMLSRLALVEQAMLPVHAPATGDHARTLARTRAVAATADRLLATNNNQPASREALRTLLADLDGLNEPLQLLTLQVHHNTIAQSEATRLALLQQLRLTWVLSALQALLLIGLAVLALRRQKQRQQQRQLAELAEERRAAQLDAEAANRAKSSFLANMSHELRTPFHGLLGMLTLLQRTTLNNRQAEQVRTAERSARQLLGILNDVLDISKLESGRLAANPAPCALPALLDEVAQLMGPLAQEKGLQLRMLLADGLPGHIMIDGLRLKQILYNLLGNAIKFTAQGEVLLHAAAAGPDRNTLVLRIIDSGPGIPPQAMAQLFTRFQQGDDSVTRHHGGTGLGLEISRSLARLMGGDIEAANQADGGACFTVSLQLQPLLPGWAPPVPPPALPLPATLPGLQVLVCEDHPINRQVMAALLDDLAVQARFCSNGQQAVQLVQQHPAHLVLMDVHTPVMDGLQATRAIRALPPPFVQPQIVALTADALGESRLRAAEAGMDDFLAKPLDPDQLTQVLARCAAQVLAPPGPTTTRGALNAGPAAQPDGASRPGPRPAPPAPELEHLAPWLDSRVIHRLTRRLPLGSYHALAQRVLHDEPGNLRELSHALQHADHAGVALAAHALKGSAANLGLAALAAAAERLENSAHEGRTPPPDATLAKLHQTVAATMSALALLPDEACSSGSNAQALTSSR